MPPAPRGASISEGPSLVPEVRAICARHYMTWPLLGSYVSRAPPPANAAARKPPPNKLLSFQPSSRHSERVSCHSEPALVIPNEVRNLLSHPSPLLPRCILSRQRCLSPSSRRTPRY